MSLALRSRVVAPSQRNLIGMPLCGMKRSNSLYELFHNGIIFVEFIKKKHYSMMGSVARGRDAAFANAKALAHGPSL
jgi:hypothetical protein